MNWGIYNKNNEQDAAMVWVGSENGKTFIAMMRATEQSHVTHAIEYYIIDAVNSPCIMYLNTQKEQIL